MLGPVKSDSFRKKSNRGDKVYSMRVELSRFATASGSRTLSCVAERDGNQGDKPTYTQFQSAVSIG